MYLFKIEHEVTEKELIRVLNTVHYNSRLYR